VRAASVSPNRHSLASTPSTWYRGFECAVDALFAARKEPRGRRRRTCHWAGFHVSAGVPCCRPEGELVMEPSVLLVLGLCLLGLLAIH
jgi:hypothetical protein